VKPDILTDGQIREKAVTVPGLYYTGGIGYEDTLTQFGIEVRDDTWAKAKEAIKQARREERQRLREEIEKATESEDLYYSATEGWRACRDYILSILEDK